MSYTFWSNTIWFILLGISTVIELLLIFLKVKNRGLVLALFLTISGMAFCFEMVIMSFFKSYTYYPMLFPQSPPDDAIAGNLFSQFSVSASALLIAVFNLKYYWFFIFSGLYVIIEESFLKLGIYQHYWYQTWMTFIVLLMFFGIVKKVYLGSSKHIGRVLRYFYIFLGLVTLHEHAIVWVLRLTGVRMLSESFLPDKEQSLVVLAGIYMLLLSTVIMLLYFTKIKWRWKLLVIAALYYAHFIAAQFHLIIYKEGWFFLASSTSIWGMYLYTYILDKLYDQNKILIKI